MYGPNTIVKVYLAPNDTYSYNNLKLFHTIIKRRWKAADILGADEAKVLENNRRHHIHYQRPLTVLGWFTTNSKYEKREKFYQTSLGDTYYIYHKKFQSYILDWWGVGGKYTKKSKKERNVKSVPNSPMFNPSVHFDKNSFMEKIYVHGKTYDEAISTTFRGKSHFSDLITNLAEHNREVEKMDDETAYSEALRVSEIVSRNMALQNNPPLSNQYAFLTNYYNKFIDPTRRIMMPLEMNLFFIKEALKHNPNLSLYVQTPDNNMLRIQGVVGQRCENIIVSMQSFKNTEKYDYEYTYSYGSNTLVNHASKGFIKAKELPKLATNVNNLMYGSKKCKIEHRYESEYMYDLVLEGSPSGEYYPWIDTFHNVQMSPDYSLEKNLKGKDIVS